MSTKPLEEVLGGDFHSLRWVASVDDGDTIRPPVTLSTKIPPDQLVVTFDTLLQRSDFVPMMKEMLARLSEQYQLPVDVEFALSVNNGPLPVLPGQNLPCTSCSAARRTVASRGKLPSVRFRKIPRESQVFRCSRMVPQGAISRVEYIVFVDPAAYHACRLRTITMRWRA